MTKINTNEINDNQEINTHDQGFDESALKNVSEHPKNIIDIDNTLKLLESEIERLEQYKYLDDKEVANLMNKIQEVLFKAKISDNGSGKKIILSEVTNMLKDDFNNMFNVVINKILDECGDKGEFKVLDIDLLEVKKISFIQKILSPSPKRTTMLMNHKGEIFALPKLISEIQDDLTNLLRLAITDRNSAKTVSTLFHEYIHTLQINRVNKNKRSIYKLINDLLQLAIKEEKRDEYNNRSILFETQAYYATRKF